MTLSSIHVLVDSRDTNPVYAYGVRIYNVKSIRQMSLAVFTLAHAGHIHDLGRLPCRTQAALSHVLLPVQTLLTKDGNTGEFISETGADARLERLVVDARCVHGAQQWVSLKVGP